MKYLSRVFLNHEDAAKLRFFDNYAWHKAAWEMFPGDREKRCFQSRLEHSHNGYILFILSDEEPMRPEWCPSECIETKRIADNFLNYDLYLFDLIANPTRKIKSFDAKGNLKPNGTRAAILNYEGQIEWLKRKAEQSGFEILDSPSLSVEHAANGRFHKKGAPGLHIGMRFSGAIRVTDRDKFREAFYHGIGTAKAFGFGMLMIKPLRLKIA
ncbi:MAG: type I-E CRISPR-associated protein Cas6/Cse3/CasE [Brevinematales bacterium]|nr:type I-E CRISPR-associated protein Cas6/Cse3/CasE [Brevinematales bacterium]